MPENDFPVEDKALFVKRLNEALVECGANRYDFLLRTPMKYFTEGNREYVRCGNRTACVNMDSLPALMGDVYRQGLL